jgi:hypothetical protein
VFSGHGVITAIPGRSPFSTDRTPRGRVATFAFGRTPPFAFAPVAIGRAADVGGRDPARVDRWAARAVGECMAMEEEESAGAEPMAMAAAISGSRQP